MLGPRKKINLEYIFIIRLVVNEVQSPVKADHKSPKPLIDLAITRIFSYQKNHIHT